MLSVLRNIIIIIIIITIIIIAATPNVSRDVEIFGAKRFFVFIFYSGLSFILKY
jgi:hypothetical protein